jgi:hypothetical protein
MEVIPIVLAVLAVTACCGLHLLLGGLTARQKDKRNSLGTPTVTLQEQNGANLGPRKQTEGVENHDSNRHSKNTQARTSL